MAQPEWWFSANRMYHQFLHCRKWKKIWKIDFLSSISSWWEYWAMSPAIWVREKQTQQGIWEGKWICASVVRTLLSLVAWNIKLNISFFSEFITDLRILLDHSVVVFVFVLECFFFPVLIHLRNNSRLACQTVFISSLGRGVHLSRTPVPTDRLNGMTCSISCFGNDQVLFNLSLFFCHTVWTQQRLACCHA